jgi:hypothetical protein
VRPHVLTTSETGELFRARYFADFERAAVFFFLSRMILVLSFSGMDKTSLVRLGNLS